MQKYSTRALLLATTVALNIVFVPSVFADDVSEADKPRMLAALSIASFDALAERCAQNEGFSAEQRAEVDRWVKNNDVDKLRTHLNGPGLRVELRDQAREGARQVVRQVPANLSFCSAAVVITRTAGAQFADKLPLIMSSAVTPTASPAVAKPPAGAPPVPGTSNGGHRLAADIEGFGFDSCTRIGYGGMVMFAPCPVVLFKTGTALTDVEGLNYPQGLAAHRAEKPGKWTQWRRQDGRVQLMKKEGWDNITYNVVYSALPKGFALDGRYHSSSGAGNTALGGGQAVIAWSDYLFRPDGHVQRDGGAGSSTTGSGVDVTTTGTRAAKTGRYRIEGLILAIDYADGSQERRVIIADPKDEGRGTLWLDGEGYVYQK